MSNQIDNNTFTTELARIVNPVLDTVTAITGITRIVHSPAETDDDKILKYAAVSAAVGLVRAQAHLADQVAMCDLYIGPEVRNMATMGTNSERPCIFLGPQIATYLPTSEGGGENATNVKGGMGQGRGVAMQMYDEARLSKMSLQRIRLEVTGNYQKSKIEAQAIAVVVHEFGHILHEQFSSARFWPLKRRDAPPIDTGIAHKVSQYAAINRLEFVAEVFTGLVYGKRYPAEVIAVYKVLGGCPVRTEERSLSR